MGTEPLSGREAWVIDGEPRPGFVPHLKESKYAFRSFTGELWIDKSDLQLAKMDVECLDTISWGLFLARFHKGTRFMLEQTRVNDEVWLPRHVQLKFDVGLALFKNFDVNVRANLPRLQEVPSDHEDCERGRREALAVGRSLEPRPDSRHPTNLRVAQQSRPRILCVLR